MMDKVKLPIKLAESMVNINRKILLDIPYMKKTALGDFPDTEILGPIYDWYLSNKELYFRAMVEGYGVEETPEDKVREYYKSVANAFGGDTYTTGYNIGARNAVTNVLDILNIKIEGVNI